ncbi:hypothetical protein INF28_02610 [Oscillospiraceae bacterium DSM 107454]|uniref:Uncharacterized protein n=2 Tax=Ructibacterium gallinarum TaxID=2779355 RepID=A0A9D5LZB4_9FIRM|nr:hypothetical protein [Ructibacterium gallinarum]
MDSQIINSSDDKNLQALKQEVEQLENITLIAIENLEEKLSSLQDITPVSDDENWSSRLDSIEVYAMEKLPPLSASIRQLSPEEFIHE